MKTLNFNIERQKCSEWCWAAVVAAVCRCYGDASPTQQCEVANLMLQLGVDNCVECDCETDAFALCNQPKNLAAVLDAVHHDRGNPTDGVASVLFNEVTSDIDAGRPVVVQVSLDDPAASGHAVAIYGYSDERVISLADPMHPNDLITINFDDFIAGRETSHGAWRAAYFTKGADE